MEYLKEIAIGVISFAGAIPVIMKYVKKVYMPLKEVEELISVIVKATEDGKLTSKEIKSIVKEGQDIIALIHTAKKRKKKK